MVPPMEDNMWWDLHMVLSPHMLKLLTTIRMVLSFLVRMKYQKILLDSSFHQFSPCLSRDLLNTLRSISKSLRRCSPLPCTHTHTQCHLLLPKQQGTRCLLPLPKQVLATRQPTQRLASTCRLSTSTELPYLRSHHLTWPWLRLHP
jgi:hypothetical protein